MSEANADVLSADWFPVPAIRVPGEAYEVTITLGLIPETNHGQWSVEVRSAPDKELLALFSQHHISARLAPARVHLIARALADWLERLSEPF